MSTVELNPVQEVGARAIWYIEHHDPKCPECHSGVLRPKCALELDPANCPRHELSGLLHSYTTLIERLSDLLGKPGWRQKARLMQLVGPPSEDDLETLRWLRDQGWKFKSPKHVNMFNSPVLRACGHWSAQGGRWTFEVGERGQAYLKEVEHA